MNSLDKSVPWSVTYSRNSGKNSDQVRVYLLLKRNSRKLLFFFAKKHFVRLTGKVDYFALVRLETVVYTYIVY